MNTSYIQIRCKNNKKTREFPIGTTLYEIFEAFDLKMPYGPVSARVNNKVQRLDFQVYRNKDVEFLDLTSSSGNRAYTRTLIFVLCKAVHDIYPHGSIVVDTPVSNGYYCSLHIGHEVTKEDIDKIRHRVQEIIDQAIPIDFYECRTEEALKIFEERGTSSVVKLLRTLQRPYTSYYQIDDYVEHNHGVLLTDTGKLSLFGIEPYYDGILLRIPSIQDPSKLGEMIRQDKMFEIFKEHHHWQDILRMQTVGDFNEAVQQGKATDIINVSEALQEKKIAHIAEEIAKRGTIKMVLIAGPSSSGKTTTCKRLSIQLVCNGIKPINISLDDYFIDREETPRDESGDYDFEHLHALNLPLLNEQLHALLDGKEVELPKYNFQTGKSEKSGRKLKLLPNEVLVVEGIHALNPELTEHIPEEHKFRVYASALTTILLDKHNYIPTTDNRLLRRIIRDYKYRGVSAQETIRRWPSVRAGENKWIFPFQENADMMFNTAMVYELAVIKQQAIPILELVPKDCEEYGEAYRLRKFLEHFINIPNRQLPPTSLLREFLGGSSFRY